MTQRDYSGEFLYEGGVLKKILFDGGYVINDVSGPVYMFFLRDHLGSVRAVVSETGVVQQRNNYFPYGDLFPNTSIDSSANRYRYTGKESGDEIGLYNFSARFLHTRFGRFTTIDPLAEKYPGISPYAYCNGNPVNFVDPDGQVPIFVITALIGAGVSGIAAVIEGKSASEILAATVGGAVDGFIGGIPVGKVMSAIKSIGLGTLGSGLGDLVELSINRAFDNQDEIDWNGFLLNFAIGGVTNTGTELTVKGIKQLGDLAINSDAAIKQLEEMLKRDAKSQGRKYTNKELSRKVNNRTKEKLHANEKLEDFNSIVLDNIIDFNNEIYGDDR